MKLRYPRFPIFYILTEFSSCMHRKIQNIQLVHANRLLILRLQLHRPHKYNPHVIERKIWLPILLSTLNVYETFWQNRISNSICMSPMRTSQWYLRTTKQIVAKVFHHVLELFKIYFRPNQQQNVHLKTHSKMNKKKTAGTKHKQQQEKRRRTKWLIKIHKSHYYYYISYSYD